MNVPLTPTRWSWQAFIATPQGELLDAYLAHLQESVPLLDASHIRLTPYLATTDFLEILDRADLLRFAGVDQASLRELRTAPTEAGRFRCWSVTYEV